MTEFLRLLTPDEARELFYKTFRPVPVVDEIEARIGSGRVLLEDIFADEPLPAFPRSTVDGYAVRGEDTYGASESMPAYLRLEGEVPMGGQPGIRFSSGSCVLIHTGGMLPEGCNAVVMIETTQVIRGKEIEVFRPVAVGENIIQVGEDLLPGHLAIPAGKRLRAEEIGGLMALGRTRVKVARRPKVGLISSGDEIVAPELKPTLGQVRDVNAHSLAAMVETVGGVPIFFGIVPDQAGVLRSVVVQALEACDIILITAGSSVSVRDMTAHVINQCGEPGVIVHGVNIKPGKPTILGICNSKPVIGLPGNPVSALVIARQFVLPIIDALQGLKDDRLEASIPARLMNNIPSQAGREDWAPVRLIRSDSFDGFTYLAEPVFGKSNLIFTLARADGMVRVPSAATGLVSGEKVDVILMS